MGGLTPSSAPDRLTDIVRNAEKQVNNPGFNEQFKEQLKQMQLTQSELIDLAKRFEESSVDRIKNDAKQMILEQMKQERQSLADTINPLNWERDTQLKVGGAIVGGTILTVLIAKGLKKMGETGRKIRNVFLGAVGATVAVAGTIIGFKLWQNWGEMQKQIERVNEATTKLMNATGEVKEKAQKELEEARAKLEAIKRERSELKQKEETTKEEGSAKTPENDAAVAEEYVKEPEASTVKEDAKPTAAEKLKDAIPYAEEKEITRTIAAQGLLTTHSSLARKAGLESKIERNSVADVLGRQDVRSLPILKLAQVQSAKDATLLLSQQAHQPTTAAQDKAIYFLGMVCNVELQNPAVHELLEKSGSKFEELTLGQFLDSVSIVPSFLGRFAKEIQGKNIKDIDVTAVLANIFSAEESIKDFESNPLIGNRIAELHPQLKDKKNLASFLFYCLGPAQKGNRSIKDVTSAESKETMSDVERDIYVPALRNISNALANPSTRNLLVQFAQGNPDHAKLIEGYLEGDLNVHDAVQLYMFLQLTRNNDEQGSYPANAADVSSTSALMLQMKILQILGNADPNSGSELKYKLLLNTAAGLVVDTKLNLPPQVRDLILTMGKFAAGETIDIVYDFFKKPAVQAWIFLKEANTNQNPIIYGPVYATEIGAGIIGGGFLKQWLSRDMIEIMTSRTKELSKMSKLRKIIPFGTETGRRARNATEMGSISNKILDVKRKILAIPNKAHSDEVWSAYNRFFKRGFDPSSFKNFYDDLSALQASGVDPAIIQELTKDIRIWESAEYGPVLQRYRFGILRRTQKRFTGQWKQTGKIRKLGGVGRGAYAGAAALEAAMVYNDYQTLEETQKRNEETLKNLEDNLQKAGFKHRYSAKGIVYEHACGARINLHSLKESITSFENVDLARLAVSSTSLAATVLAPSLVLGPGGWVVGGIAVAIEAGITSWEQVKQRDFIMNTPTPILALLGLGSAIGADEQDMIEEVSNGMISDLALKDGNKDKTMILKKTYTILFCQHMAELGKTNPDLVAEITQGRDMAELFDENGEFFNQDFQQIIKPYLALRMFQLSQDQNVKWSEFKDLKIDEGWFDERNIRPQDMGTALKEAAELYLNHLREKRYQEALKSRDEELTELTSHIDPQDPVTQADYDIAEDDWNKTLEVLGQSLVRSTPVNRLPASPNGMTSTAANLKEVTDGLNTRYPNATRGEIPLQEMYVFQTPEAPQQSGERYDVFFREAQASYYRAKEANLNEWAQTYIVEFNKIMQRFPDFDLSGKWKTQFSKMPPSADWNSFGTKKEVSTYYRQSLKVMEQVLEDTVDRHAEFHPEALENRKGKQSMFVGDSTEIYLVEHDLDQREKSRISGVVNTAKELHVVIDGKDTLFTANENAGNRWQTPNGFLQCAVQTTWKNGVKEYSYHWSFEGTKTGTLEVYHKNKLGQREPGVMVEIQAPSKKEIPVESLAVVDFDNPPLVFDATLTMNDGKTVTLTYMELRKLSNNPLIEKVLFMADKQGNIQRCRLRLSEAGKNEVRSVSFKEPIGEHSETIFRKKNAETEPGLYKADKTAA